jgi:HTH-type transcriptional regulator / antitoxin HigA
MTNAVIDNRKYAQLVRKFPPRPIHSARQYDDTLAVMNRLAMRDEDTLSPAEADYLDALATFVEEYDRVQFAEPPAGTPVERLRYLIEQSGMTASDLGRLLGNRGLGSILLTGKRELSKTHIRILADHFRLDAGYFL